jgi:hypothetical protein
VPMVFHQSAPPSTMYGTLAMVPTLLTTVGQAYRPWVAGNGGRSRGWPRKPSSESSSAVSHPDVRPTPVHHQLRSNPAESSKLRY